MSEALRMLATLRMLLQMFMAANVANFANIRDKKRLRGLWIPAGSVWPCASKHEKSGEFPRLSVLSFGVMLSFVAWINNPPSVQRHFVVLLKRHNYDAYAVGLGGDHYFGIVYDSIKIFFYVVLQVF
ncbi:hypothetical protein NE651_12400 [Alistipes onderdonkii]|uniref:Uncharacterized protein n=2 Tax=Alistipes onderdonkii TaxID=328813 RepID=A0AAJ1CFM1_9BACT|nr:hypothetical protein [Alistipes onderdonkii]